MELDDPVCYCFHVSKRKVLNFIRIYQPKRPSQLSECNGAGTGCGWCISYLKRFFADSQVENAPELTAAEYAEARGAYIRAGKGKPPPGAIPAPSPGDGV